MTDRWREVYEREYPRLVRALLAIGRDPAAAEDAAQEAVAQGNPGLRKAGALIGATDHSTTKALYARDPDGLEFEVCWLVPAQFLDDDVVNAKTQLRPLNLEADIERYGLETVGGV